MELGVKTSKQHPIDLREALVIACDAVATVHPEIAYS